MLVVEVCEVVVAEELVDCPRVDCYQVGHFQVGLLLNLDCYCVCSVTS